MGGSTNTTTTNSAPWIHAQPFLRNIMDIAQKNYDSGAGSNVWKGPALSAMDPMTQQAMDMTRSTAQSGGALPYIGGALDTMQNNATGPGPNTTGGSWMDMYRDSQTMNNPANSAMRGMLKTGGVTTAPSFGKAASAANSMNDRNVGMLGNIAGQAGGATAADKYLTGMASGAQIGDNPYISKIADDNASRIRDQVASSMAGAGRYGSFAHGDALTNAITSANNPLFAQAYESDRNRQLQATGLLGDQRATARGQQIGAIQAGAGINQGDLGLHLNALTGATAAQDASADNRMGAATNLANSNRAGMGMSAGLLGELGNTQMGNANFRAGAARDMMSFAPTLDNMLYRPGQEIGRMGEYMQNRGQAELNNQRNIFEQENMVPWTQLQRLTGGILGGGSQGGMNTQTAPGPSPWMQAAGLGGAAAPILLQMLSDRNEKTDIKRLGTSESTGLPIYAYRYKGDSKSSPKVVGAMAQDVEKAFPGSTGLIGGKMYVKPHAVGLLGAL